MTLTKYGSQPNIARPNLGMENRNAMQGQGTNQRWPRYSSWGYERCWCCDEVSRKTAEKYFYYSYSAKGGRCGTKTTVTRKAIGDKGMRTLTRSFKNEDWRVCLDLKTERTNGMVGRSDGHVTRNAPKNEFGGLIGLYHDSHLGL